MNPTEEHEVETDRIGEMDTTGIKEAEVRQVLNNAKSGKHQESMRSQQSCTKQAATWKGLIVKLPEKGDVKGRKNLRGVKLLPDLQGFPRILLVCSCLPLPGSFCFLVLQVIPFFKPVRPRFHHLPL